LEAGTTRKISIKIAQSLPTTGFPNTDTASLAKAKAAEVSEDETAQEFCSFVMCSFHVLELE